MVRSKEERRKDCHSLISPFSATGVYFAVVMLLVSMSCLVTVAILVVHHRGGHGRRLPLWLRRAFLKGLGPWLLVHTRAEEESGCFSCNVCIFDNARV